MKIERRGGLPGTELSRSESAALPKAARPSFSEIMEEQAEQLSRAQLQELLDRIELQGERFAKGMTIRNLLEYKLLVKQFLEKTARKAVSLKESKGWDRRGRGKRYKLLDEVDRRLRELADDMLLSEEGRLSLLRQIGEIRGMLINLLF